MTVHESTALPAGGILSDSQKREKRERHMETERGRSEVKTT